MRLPAARDPRVRSHVGMVFQQFNLWPHMTALGNVAEALVRVAPAAAPRGRGPGLAQLEPVGLANRAGHYPAQLSGGQQQRVAIARALALRAAHPALRRADLLARPRADRRGAERDARRSPTTGMTMLVVTHEIGFAASVAAKIVFLDHGKVLVDGPPAKVFGKPRHPRIEQFLETYLDRGAATLL